MKIIIVGCGKVGSSLAEQLSKEGNDITIIDQDVKKVHALANELDVMGVVGNGSNHSIQQEAGIESADLLIAVTNSDALNLLCCLIAKKAGDCQTIARIRNPEYSREARFIQEELGLAMILNPELAIASEIARLLRFPSAIKNEPFAKGRIELMQFRLTEDSDLCNMQVYEITTVLKCDVLVCAVVREGQVIIPNGSFVLLKNDIVSIVAEPKNASQFFKKIKIKTDQAKSAMIIGGSTTAFYLTQQLLAMGIRVKIIDKDYKRCEFLADVFPKATIICGDGTESKLLEEEGLEYTDSLVALTNLDEENILLTLAANDRYPKLKTITKINNATFDGIIQKLNIDRVINTKSVTSEYIIRYVRAMNNSIGSNVETLHRLVNDRLEALEFNIRENAPVLNIPIQDLPLKENLLVACIIRDQQNITPRGQDCMMLGDKVIIVTTNTGLKDIRDILIE